MIIIAIIITVDFVVFERIGGLVLLLSLLSIVHVHHHHRRQPLDNDGNALLLRGDNNQ